MSHMKAYKLRQFADPCQRQELPTSHARRSRTPGRMRGTWKDSTGAAEATVRVELKSDDHPQSFERANVTRRANVTKQGDCKADAALRITD
jgi:hypothetical protein